MSIDYTSRIGKLRAIINDVNEDSFELEDDQLRVFLELSSCNLLQASLLALRALISKYSASAGDEYRVDTIQYKEGKQKAQYYQNLLDNIQKSIEDGTNPLLSGVPRVYGIYQWTRDENYQRMLDGEIIPPRTSDFEYDQIILKPDTEGPYYRG